MVYVAKMTHIILDNKYNKGGTSMKYKCLDCGKEFDEWDVTECLEEDDEDDVVCCPYCGSDDVKDT